MDLSSTNPSVQANLGSDQTASINVGGSIFTVIPGTRLTPAEQVAVWQVIRTGQQSLVLGAGGNAIGGSVNLTNIRSAINDLVIPRGVTALRNFATAPTFKLLGNFTNAGQLYAFSSNPAVQTATISATNISNQQNAVISTILPSGGLSGVAGAVSNLNLNLSAINDIINAGTISSAGNLHMSAGGSIVNSLPAGASGPGPAIQAMNNVNMIANNIVNSGTITAMAGNVNVQAMTAGTLAVNNAAGTLQALAGAINIGSPSAANNIDVKGGDILSRQLNLSSKDGKVNLDAGNVTGTVNVSACEAHITTATDNLTLGDINLTGDPTFFNTTGDVTISQNLIFSGQPLAIVALGNIKTAPGAGIIDTSSFTGNGGPITLIAGANLLTVPSGVVSGSNDNTTQLVVGGGSSIGGDIDLTGGGTAPIFKFSSSSFAVNGSGGNVHLIAFGNASGSKGNILLPQTLTITSGGGSGAAANNGNVTVLASTLTSSTTPSGITLGGINTVGSPNSGNIFIATTIPVLHNGLNIVIQPGGAIASGSFDPGTLGTGFLSLGAVTSGGNVSLNSAANLTLNENITASGKAVALVSATNILRTSLVTQIDTSANAVSGGAVTLIAGFNFNGTEAGQVTITTANTAAGSIYLPNTQINTSSQQSSGGSFTAAAFGGGGGNVGNTGMVSLGAINASGKTTVIGLGGAVKIVADGGVQIGGAINTQAVTGGQVSIFGEQPTLTGPFVIENGVIQQGGVLNHNGHLVTGQAILVNGNITTSGLAGRGGDVTLASDVQIEVTGSITATGTSGPGNDAGGDVNIDSDTSFVSVGFGGINTSSVAAAGASGQIAGDIIIFAGSRITINGNLQVSGQNSTSGGGGHGGSLTLFITNLGANGHRLGNVLVNGFIESRGGSGTTTTGLGGGISINAGTLQIMGANNGVSINNSNGNGTASASAITITTSDLQPLPDNFDLASSVKSVVSVPGQIFTIQVANPVNGSVGTLVNGGNIVSQTTAGGPNISGTFNVGNVFVNTQTNSGLTITENGAPLIIGPLVPGNPNQRQMLTPAEALAVYQVQHGQTASQIRLNASGQLEPTTLQTATVAGSDISKPFTAFNLIGVGANADLIQLNITGLRPVVSISSPVSKIAGSLRFPDSNTIAILDFGNGAMNVSGPNGSIVLPNFGTLILAGFGGVWTNNGTITAGSVVLAPAFPLTINMGSGASINGQTIISPEMNSNIFISLNASLATLGGAVTFTNIRVPAIYTSLAQRTALNFNVNPAVFLNFSLLGPSQASQTATISGTLSASTLFINTTNGISGAFQLPTPLAIDGSLSATQFTQILTSGSLSLQTGSALGNSTSGPINLIANGLITVSSGIRSAQQITVNAPGGVNLAAGSNIAAGGNIFMLANGAQGVSFSFGSTLTAGSLVGTPTFGPLVQSQIAKFGSIIIQAVGPGGLSIPTGVPVNLTSNGGDILIIANIPGPAFQTTSPVNLTANGGNILLNLFGAGTMTFVGNPSLKASTLNGGSGNIQLIFPKDVSFGIGSVINGLGQTLLFVNDGAFTFSGTTLSSGFNMIIQAVKGMTFGGTAQVAAGNTLQLFSGGATSGITLNVGASLTAGSLAAGAPAFPSPLTQANIAKPGSIFIQALGSGGFTVAGVGTPTNITSNGGDIFITSTIPSAGIVLPSQTKFQANGGSIFLNFNALGNVAASQIRAVFNASTLNGGAGNIILTSTGDLTFVGTAVMDARGFIQMNAINAVLDLGGIFYKSASNMTLFAQKGVSVAPGVALSAGVLGATAPPITIPPAVPVPLITSDIAKPGSIFIQSFGNGPTLFDAGSVTTVTSNGGDILITTTIPAAGLSIPATAKFTANGGNIILSAFPSAPGPVPVSSIAPVLKAGTLNGAGGNIFFTVAGGYICSTGTDIQGLGLVQLTSSGGGLSLIGNYSAGSNLFLSGVQGVSTTSNATLSAGTLAPGAPIFPNPLTSANILKPGSIIILAPSTSGFNLAGQGASLTSNGGDIFISSNGNGTSANGLNLLANGGNIILNLFGTGQSNFGLSSSFKASTLNGVGGNIQILSSGAINFSSGSVVQALGFIQMNVFQGSCDFFGTTLSANSNLTYFSQGGISISAAAAQTINAAQMLLNNTTGTVALGGPTTQLNVTSLTVNSPTITVSGQQTATGTISLNASTGLTVFGQANLTAGNNLNVSQMGGPNALVLAAGASLKAGSIQTDSGTGIVNTTTAGTIKPGSVNVTAFPTGVNGITGGQGVKITSHSGDIILTSTGIISLDSSDSAPASTTIFKANGGNIFVMSQKSITEPATATGITFIARAIGNPAVPLASIGGGIQLSAGTQAQQVFVDFARPPGTLPNPITVLGNGLTVNNNLGAIVANTLGGGIINLAGNNLPSTLNLSRGAMHFDALGAGNNVTINKGTFQTFGLRPISYISPAAPEYDADSSSENLQVETIGTDRPAFHGVKSLRVFGEPGTQFATSLQGDIQLMQGILFLEAPAAIKLHTRLADVLAGKRALVELESTGTRVSVRCLSGVREVSVVVAGKRIDLCSGQELIVTEGQPQAADLGPQDGIGRRQHRTFALDHNLHATICDFSVTSALVNSSQITRLRHSGSSADRKLLNRLIHSAAAVDTVMKNKGVYKATPKPIESPKSYTAAYLPL